MKSIFLIALFLIKISGMIAQVSKVYKPFSQVIVYGKDQRAYTADEKCGYANGAYFLQPSTRYDYREYFFVKHQEIEIIEMLYRYQCVTRCKLLCDSYFEDGKPSGKWILKTEDNDTLGLISFKNGLFDGQTYIRCVDSKRAQIINYKNGIRLDRIELDRVGDTILYYGDKQQSFSYKHGETALNQSFCDWHKLKKDTIPNPKVVDDN